jgi:transposase
MFENGTGQEARSSQMMMVMTMLMMMRNACTWLTTQKQQLKWKRDHVLLRYISGCVQQTSGPSVYLRKWFSDLLCYLTKETGTP